MQMYVAVDLYLHSIKKSNNSPSRKGVHPFSITLSIKPNGSSTGLTKCTHSLTGLASNLKAVRIGFLLCNQACTLFTMNWRRLPCNLICSFLFSGSDRFMTWESASSLHSCNEPIILLIVFS